MLRDCRYAFRRLLSSPAVFFATVVLLAAGVGANTAVFSAINHLLIRPLPFRSPGRLAVFGEMNRTRGIRSGVSRETFEIWAARSRELDSVGALQDGQIFALPGHRESLHGARVSANLFDVLGVRPAIGRTFDARDSAPGAPNVVIVTDEYWSARWARDPGVLGRTLEMSDRKWTIVGVLPPGFRMLYSSASVWVPLEPGASQGTRAFAIGRLRSGSTALRASAELSAFETASEPGWAAWGKPLREYMVGPRRPIALLLFVTVGLLLATACLNVGAVLTARATGRLKETAIRISLGASGWRLFRDALSEAIILAAVGTAAGLATVVAARKLAVAAVPELGGFTIDRTVLAFAFGLMACSTLVMTCGPALVARRAHAAAAALKGARLRATFVVAQTALAVMLLVGVGVLVRGLKTLQSTDPGFESADVIVAEVGLPGPAHPARAKAFAQAALENAASEPSVKSAAVATAMPLFGPDRAAVEVEGGATMPGICRRSISPEYFALFEIPFLRGRSFSKADRLGAPRVAVVNERAAQLFWPGSEAVGKRIRFESGEWATVVGVSANVRSLGLRTPPQPEIFSPFAQDPTARVSLALRVQSGPAASIPVLYKIAAAADSRAEVTYTNTMPALLDEQLALVRALSGFGAVSVALALLLAGTGLYGAVSCLYAQRTKEIGIRMALGATPRAITRMVAASAARLAGMGCLVGLVAGAALGRLFQAAVLGVAGVDQVVVAGAIAVTLAVSIGATLAPARRAANVEPSLAVRCD